MRLQSHTQTHTHIAASTARRHPAAPGTARTVHSIQHTWHSSLCVPRSHQNWSSLKLGLMKKKEKKCLYFFFDIKK